MMPQHFPRALAGELVVFDYPASADHYAADADGRGIPVLDRRLIADRCRIEQHQVGDESACNLAAVLQADMFGWQERHLVDRDFERQGLLLAHVVTENAWEGAGTARMLHEQPTVAAERDARIRNEPAYVVVGHGLDDDVFTRARAIGTRLGVLDDLHVRLNRRHLP